MSQCELENILCLLMVLACIVQNHAGKYEYILISKSVYLLSYGYPQPQAVLVLYGKHSLLCIKEKR